MRRGSTASSTGSLHTTTSVPTMQQKLHTDPRSQLYHRSRTVLAKLRRIPQLDVYEQFVVQPTDSLPPHLAYTLDITPPNALMDPISLLRRLFRLGAPLTLLFNVVQHSLPATSVPHQPLDVLPVEECGDIKKVKRAIYRFCEACAHDLGLRIDQDLFTISQIFHDSVFEMFAPLKTVELLLARLDAVQPNRAPGSSLTGPIIDRRLSSNSTYSTNSSGSAGVEQASVPKDKRDMVIEEMIRGERSYVSDLELLTKYSEAMIANGIPRETAHAIVPQVSKILEFQQRVLAGCEHQIALYSDKPQQMRFGWLFLHLLPDFQVYNQYIISQKDAVDTACTEVHQLQIPALLQLAEPIQALPMLLLSPVQRIMKYRPLIERIMKYTPENWPYNDELASACEAIQDMTAGFNETQRRHENKFIFKQLQERVQDWRGLDISSMGELLLTGNYPVASVSGGTPGNEEEYYLYLFEHCLLCCRDRVQSHKKSALTKMRPSASSISSRNSQSVQLEIRGRIYMRYVLRAKVTKLQVGGYQLRLSWSFRLRTRADAREHGTIDIRLPSEERAVMWEKEINKLSADYKSHSPSGTPPAATPSGSLNTPVASPAVTSPTASASARYSFRKSHGSGRTSLSSISRSSDEVNFWDDIDTSRKLSVSSVSSQLSDFNLRTDGRSSTQIGSPISSTSSMAATVTGNAAIAASAQAHYHQSRQKSDSSGSLMQDSQRRVRLHAHSDNFLVVVPAHVGFDEFMGRVERKLKLTGTISQTTPFKTVRLEYLDEDRDRVRLESEDDLLTAFEAVSLSEELAIYVSVNDKR